MLSILFPEPVPDLRFEPVSDKYDLSAFDCGAYTWLNDHLRRGYALRDEAADRLRTYLLIRENPDAKDAPVVVGFFALEASLMPTADLPAAAQGELALPPNLPVIYLTMLARHKDYAGYRFGPKLMVEAIYRSVTASASIGAVGMYAYALAIEAYRLNTNFGFHDFDPDSADGKRMYLPMSHARGFIAENPESAAF